MGPTAVAIAGLLLGLFPAGAALAGFKIDIEYDAPAPASDMIGRIEVTFEDARPAKKGGMEPDLIGQIRGGYGNPFGLFTRSIHPDEIVPQYVLEGLLANGVDVVDDRDAPRLHVTLLDFWTDGYVHNRLRVEVDLDLYEPGGGRLMWHKSLRLEDGTAGWPPKKLARGYRRLLEAGFDEMEHLFGRSDFLDLANQRSSRSREAEGDRRDRSGCVDDTECKGSRTCVRGHCVEATDKCGKDVDCPGDQVCRAGRCSNP